MGGVVVACVRFLVAVFHLRKESVLLIPSEAKKKKNQRQLRMRGTINTVATSLAGSEQGRRTDMQTTFAWKTRVSALFCHTLHCLVRAHNGSVMGR